MLAQESDGQISLVMPEAESIEKQITGQINIEDILAEWERKKKKTSKERRRSPPACTTADRCHVHGI
ncbi:hypothetical protein [Waltera sp.]|uniref:hypothetical protein n=1 Tax=Waltera sp. TaxID=2815806 RepID=UPI003990A20A